MTKSIPMGHEYCGLVEEVGKEVVSIKPGQFVIGYFFSSIIVVPIAKQVTSRPAGTRN